MNAIYLFTFRKLKFRIAFDDPDWEVTIFKDDKIKLQKIGEKWYLVIVPNDITTWKPFVK